jgi:hypothetical protein
MFSIPELNAFQRRLARERITRIIERSMRAQSTKPDMTRPPNWVAERPHDPAMLLMMTSSTLPHAPARPTK